MTTRRRFLAGLAAALASGPGIAGPVSPPTPSGFFRLTRIGERWWLLDPQGRRFFSLGLNHVDPASLRYEENVDLWRVRYGGSMERWLSESVAPNLARWGFNTLGWNQEAVCRGETIHRHSRRFTFDEYQWLGMPYCHQLPFGEFHQWEVETRHPDFFSSGFADWCDHVAREHCAPFARDEKLVGYFYIDCPTWLHTREGNRWRGPIFDPADLATATGRAELLRIAGRYYSVTYDAIRRYDPNHLILGDRYEANERLSMEIFEAARPFVDVLSFQDFKDPVANLARWHETTGMPVLWADGSKAIRQPDGSRRQDGEAYAAILGGLRAIPGCVGAHLCGAYIRNRVRRKGLLDERERPDAEAIEAITKANRDTAAWVRTHSDP